MKKLFQFQTKVRQFRKTHLSQFQKLAFHNFKQDTIHFAQDPFYTRNETLDFSNSCPATSQIILIKSYVARIPILCMKRMNKPIFFD